MLLPYRHILTENDRQRMLATIARVALAIGQDLAPESSLEDGDLTPLSVGESLQIRGEISPRERVAFLAAGWAKIENALRRIEAAPDTVLVPERRNVPMERSKRATAKDLLFALTRSVPGARDTRRVWERVSLPSSDTPANRLIKGVLTIYLRDMTAAAELAAVVGAKAVEEDALRLRVKIRRALRRPPWQTLPPSPSTQLPPLPQSVRQNGPYRLLYDTYRKYRQGFRFDWGQPLFHLPSREMWLLYEYWCLFETARSLRTLGFRTVAAEDFLISRSGLTFTLVRGKTSSLRFADAGGQVVTLTYNRHFPPQSEARSTAAYSRSHGMRPDIVVESGGRLLVLDAKFKPYSEAATNDEEDNLPLTADINQCHAYRDGILSSGRPCVSAAWLLYPGKVGGNNRPVISYRTGVHQLESEVGALLLRPGQANSLLTALLHDFLQAVRQGPRS